VSNSILTTIFRQPFSGHENNGQIGEG